MKRLFFRLLMLPLMFAAAACAPHPDSAEVSGETQTRIPVAQADGSYKMELVQLSGVNNLFELNGQFAKFFLSPRVVDGHLDGVSPRGHFVKSGSTYIAADELSLQLATIYAHMQKFATLDVELGAGGLNKWPRDIGVGVRITGGMNNNAFYDGSTDAMLFVPYVGKDLPIPVNAGILAHEHFHSLFYKLVMIPLQKGGMLSDQIQGSVHSQREFYQLVGLSQKGDRGDVMTGNDQTHLYYHLLLIRGLNEGLADFWGWLYTGNPNFIAKSLPNELERNMEVAPEDRSMVLRLESVNSLRSRVQGWQNAPRYMMARINQRAYDIGTVYSRIFKAFTDAHAEARGVSVDIARKDVARAILKTLPQMRENLLRQAADQYYEPTQFVQSFVSEFGALKKAECDVMKEVMNLNSRTADAFECQASGESFLLAKSAKASPIETPPVQESATATPQPTPTPEHPVVFSR